jgi:5,10-methylenetetrahydromethanopterin reductase
MGMFDRLGIMIDSGKCGFPGGTRAVVDEAKWAEEAGFFSVWVGESRLSVDALVPITLIASETSRIKVGSGVLPYRTRNAALIALTFKTLETMAPGRMRLGLGAWWEPLATQTGLPNRKPLTAMREVLTVVSGLLDGGTVSLDGEFVNVRDIRFDGLADDVPKAYGIPLYIGAVRPKMVALAGELCDGVLLDFLVPPSYTVDALGWLAEGAARSGRDLAGFEVPQLIGFAVDDHDPAAAVDTCRSFLTQYIAQQPHIAEYCGAEPEVVARIQAEAGWPATKAEIRNAMRHVPDSLVHSVAATGTVTQALDKIGEWIDAGCTEPVLTALGDAPLDGFQALARKAGLTGE